jgi:hypothetical protein
VLDVVVHEFGKLALPDIEFLVLEGLLVRLLEIYHLSSARQEISCFEMQLVPVFLLIE